MKRIFAAGVLLSVTAFATPVYAQGNGNGGLNGTHYNLNILGKDNCSGDDLTGSNRHTIQVLLNYHDDSPTQLTSDPVLDKKNKQATITMRRALLKPGPLKGTIRIETNDPEFPVLSVPVSGLVLPSPATK